MIELRELTKDFKGIRAVDRVSLSVEEGVIFGFLGPNGAGKTTTIKMMSGILEPTCGKIVLGGVSLDAEPEAAKRLVGYIPDRPFLYEKLTAREFLGFVADIYWVKRGSARQSRMGRLLELFELTSWQDELIEGFSHGMKQRLVMAAALLHEPRILLVDEPMVGLDPKAAQMVKGILRDLAGKGVTVFMSTHSLSVAEELCQQVVIINKGRIAARGTPDELRKQAGKVGSLEEAFLEITGEENN